MHQCVSSWPLAAFIPSASEQRVLGQGQGQGQGPGPGPGPGQGQGKGKGQGAGQQKSWSCVPLLSTWISSSEEWCAAVSSWSTPTAPNSFCAQHRQPSSAIVTAQAQLLSRTSRPIRCKRVPFMICAPPGREINPVQNCAIASQKSPPEKSPGGENKRTPRRRTRRRRRETR